MNFESWSGGQFASARGGQFGSAKGGHIKSAVGGQVDRRLQSGFCSKFKFSKRIIINVCDVFIDCPIENGSYTSQIGSNSVYFNAFRSHESIIFCEVFVIDVSKLKFFIRKFQKTV